MPNFFFAQKGVSGSGVHFPSIGQRQNNNGSVPTTGGPWNRNFTANTYAHPPGPVYDSNATGNSPNGSKDGAQYVFNGTPLGQA